jgi:predicted RNA-binding protein with RPS1 domain
MKFEIDQLVIGKVTKVKPFALFMEFEGGVEGLLHISEISDSYIRDIEKFGSKVMKSKSKSFPLMKPMAFCAFL